MMIIRVPKLTLPHVQLCGRLAQEDKSAWTRADVIRYLGRALPRSGMDPAAAASLLEDRADRVFGRSSSR